MAYRELIKDFEKIREYMRDFYVYGFKSRSEYDQKSLRTYDNERRRIASWLDDYMSFVRTKKGNNVFISVDCRNIHRNPLYKGWKAKSFTDLDITLHFYLLDILYEPKIKKTINELCLELDKLLGSKVFIETSTLRAKINEYVQEGILVEKREGRVIYYCRATDVDISKLNNVIDFYSEVAPCGVIGSFLQDRLKEHQEIFTFKHHYITSALDSEVLCQLFEAMERKCFILVDNLARRLNEKKTVRLIPLRIYISAQNGKQNLLAYHVEGKLFNTYRIDYLSNVKILDYCEQFDQKREEFAQYEKHMWGVSVRNNLDKLQHVEFDIKIEDDERYVYYRLHREKRCGKIKKINKNLYRFSADVFDCWEMLPWIRSYICRITRIEFSDKEVEKTFKEDLNMMYEMYGI